MKKRSNKYVNKLVSELVIGCFFIYDHNFTTKLWRIYDEFLIILWFFENRALFLCSSPLTPPDFLLAGEGIRTPTLGVWFQSWQMCAAYKTLSPSRATRTALSSQVLGLQTGTSQSCMRGQSTVLYRCHSETWQKCTLSADHAVTWLCGNFRKACVRKV